MENQSTSRDLDKTLAKISSCLGAESNTSIIFIELNNFSETKTQLGLAAALRLCDEVQKVIATEVQARNQASIFQGLQSGALVLLPEARGEDALQLAEHICTSVEALHFDIASEPHKCSVSAGALDASECQEDVPEQVLNKLFETMEKARSERTLNTKASPAMLFAAASTQTPTQATELLDYNALVADNSLRAVYQPIINLHGEDFSCYEATLQIQLGDKLLSGSDIVSNLQPGDTCFDKWLVVESTKSLLSLGDNQSTQLILNLSEHALLDEGFPEWLRMASKASGIQPQNVMLQFHESALARNLQKAREFQANLADTPFRFCISHFGLHGNPVALLEQFESSFVMTDISFTQALAEDAKNLDQLRELMLNLKQTQAKSIVPGVESATMLASLWQVNVAYIQGEYLQGPSDSMSYEFAEAAA